jgi:hypothetical protein
MDAKAVITSPQVSHHPSISVVEMISELLDPLNARGGPVKLYRPAISYISICTGLNGPSELKESSSKLNIRDPSWRAEREAEQEVAEVDVKSKIWNVTRSGLAPPANNITSPRGSVAVLLLLGEHSHISDLGGQRLVSVTQLIYCWTILNQASRRRTVGSSHYYLGPETFPGNRPWHIWKQRSSLPGRRPRAWGVGQAGFLLRPV